MHRASCRLGEHGRVDREAFGREDQALGNHDVLREETGKVASESLECRATDRVPGEAVVAQSAVHVRVDGDLLADVHPGDPTAHRLDGPDKLVAGDQAETRR